MNNKLENKSDIKTSAVVYHLCMKKCGMSVVGFFCLGNSPKKKAAFANTKSCCALHVI